jgi:hypothetical protein
LKPDTPPLISKAMSRAAQNLKDVLSLARLLRRMAERHAQDSLQDEFLSIAGELETRADVHAAESRPAGDRLHAPVNLVI